MCQCGAEDCAPNHDYGPAVRDHYLIHCIRGGRGVFRVGEKVYHLRENQGFLICPGIVTYYRADGDDPWRYAWVGFNGRKAQHYLEQAGLSQDKPIFTYARDGLLAECLARLVETAATAARGREIRLLGFLYVFLSGLLETAEADPRPETQREFYVRRALEYLEMEYYRDISVAGVAKHLGLDRSYFSALFRAEMGVPPRDYLIRHRIEKACELMRDRRLTIAEVARSVGYADPLQFSKAFKRLKGLPPKGWRWRES
ncbi:MAG: AraC family transcriptional regulator [Bacteroidota bacterium]